MWEKIKRYIKLSGTLNSFLSGILGGMLIVSIVFFVLFKYNIFNYNFSTIDENIKIYNQNKIDSLSPLSMKAHIIKELERDHLILSPQEYTNSIVNYYNTMLSLLIAMLVIFSIASYIHLRFVAKKQVIDDIKEIIKDSKEFDNSVMTALFGKAQENFIPIEELEKINSKFNDIDSIIKEMNSQPDQENNKFIEEI